MNHIAQRILVHVGRMLQQGTMDEDKLIKAVIRQCLPEGVTPDERTTSLITQRMQRLLNPLEDGPLIEFLRGGCDDNCQEQLKHCIDVCPTDAIAEGSEGKTIDQDLCIECGHCVTACTAGVIFDRSEFVQVATMLMAGDDQPLYAIVAPSFVGQFGDDVQPEQVKGTLKLMGFTEVYEVALAADMITNYEAWEFLRRVERGDQFMITSCCCPAFIKLVEKRRPNLSRVISESVSPMIALGRLLKAREPHSRVVFIGPCIAKKGEAKQADLDGAIDCVLTYRETEALFAAAELVPSTMPALELADASHDGRGFAYTGGVTNAITSAILLLEPSINIKAVQGNGIKECNQLLAQIEDGTINANFMEGMACPNGCVGGPGTIIESAKGERIVKEHALQSDWATALANTKATAWEEETPLSDELLSPKLGQRVPT